MSEPKVPEGYRHTIRYFKGFDEQDRCLEYTTSAHIYSNDTNELVATGVAFLNPNEKPCRKTGRHVALGRAIQQLQEELN